MKSRCYLYFSYCLTVILFLLGILLGNQAVTTMVEKAPVIRKHTIIIDAGHGGEDGGATSCTGRLESTYNLEISLRLNDLFSLLGHGTKMIRTTDRSVYTQGETIAQKKRSDLKERVRIVNDTENALLLSIHQNHYPDSRYHGAQVFFSSGEGSETLAKALQSAFVSILDPASRRQAKKSEGIYLMDKINGTGVLVECGFLSNPGEEIKLRNPEYQKLLVCIIACKTSSFLSNT